MNFPDSLIEYSPRVVVEVDDAPKLVSIVLATYNAEIYLAKQLDSLLGQSYPNVEIIAVDDCSTDKTVQILQEYASRHNRMKVVVNELNLGFVKNFDKGCSLATGAFISLCDQDDYWHEDKLKKLVEAIGSHSLAYCDSYLCNQDLQMTGKKISDIVNCMPFYNCLQQAIFCRIYGHATLFTRELYNSSQPFLEVIPHDWWLSYSATLQKGITYLPEALVYYRQHKANLFGAVGGKRRKQHKVNKKQLEKNNILIRINAFYEACPAEFTMEKRVLNSLVKSYGNFSLINNFQRVIIFLRCRNWFLAVKKHSALHKFFFCFKMLVKIK